MGSSLIFKIQTNTTSNTTSNETKIRSEEKLDVNIWNDTFLPKKGIVNI